jgi:hypothetical protein
MSILSVIDALVNTAGEEKTYAMRCALADKRFNAGQLSERQYSLAYLQAAKARDSATRIKASKVAHLKQFAEDLRALTVEQLIQLRWRTSDHFERALITAEMSAREFEEF